MKAFLIIIACILILSGRLFYGIVIEGTDFMNYIVKFITLFVFILLSFLQRLPEVEMIKKIPRLKKIVLALVLGAVLFCLYCFFCESPEIFNSNLDHLLSLLLVYLVLLFGLRRLSL